MKLKLNLLLVVLCVSIVFATGSAFAQSITGSAHDFSSESWNNGEICNVCHAPHNNKANVTPLWNHELSTATYTLYNSSSTLDANDVAQPDETTTSGLCLSCHDGTVAIDNFGGNSGSVMMTGNAELGTDLSNDHPVNFTYDASLATADGGLADPATTNSGLGGTIAHDMLRGGKLQCTSCHNPHDKNNGKFLVKSNSGSDLCLTCHEK
ncbi:MAG: cytochrome c3 family protein [Calditrichaeota bacterium]|nr:cytochrome c3 family protein [Calditrichota bacterium]